MMADNILPESFQEELLKKFEIVENTDTYRKILARYKSEVLKIDTIPDRNHMLYKVFLKEGISLSLMQEMQYDLNLMKANAMLMINPQPDGLGDGE